MFEAEAPERAEWSGEVWPGRNGLAIIVEDGRRAIVPMRWGLPERAARRISIPDPRGALAWFRELWPRNVGLLAPERRCLIVVESFARPAGEVGYKTRTWYGSDRSILLGWPGIWLEAGDERGFIGFLVAGSALVAPDVSMPALLLPSQSASWLAGDLVTASKFIRTHSAVEGLYREATKEPW